MQSVLDIALANNAKVSDHFDGRLPEHVILFVGQCLAGGHHYGVTC